MNLIKHPQTCLGFSIGFDGPSTTAELEAIVGADAGLRSYMQQESFKRNSQMYPLICERLEQITGKERGYEIATKADGTPKLDENDRPVKSYKETAEKFLNRLQSDDEVKHLVPDSVVEEVIRAVNEEFGPWTFKPVSDRKPAEQFYAVADKALAAIAAGEKTKESSIAKIEATLGVSFVATFGEFNRDNLARAVKAIDTKKRAELMAEAL